MCLKTADGHMSVHSWPSGKLASSWKVPGCGSSSTPSYSKRSCFAHTRDGRFVCVGESCGCWCGERQCLALFWGWGVEVHVCIQGAHLEYKSRAMAIKSLKASAQVHCDAWMRNSTRLWPH